MQFPATVAASHVGRPTWIALALVLSLGSGSARSQHPVDSTALGSTAQTLIDYARQGNPGFAAARAEASAAHERVTPAGALPDPRIGVELMDATNTMNGRAASLLPGQVGETRYSITQPLPGWGKRRLSSKAAEAQARRADAVKDVAWTDLVARIETLWLRYYAADRELELVRQGLVLLQGLEETSLARYQTGQLPQQAVLRMQREITSQRVALLELEQRRKGLAAGLNGLVGREHDAPMDAPEDFSPLPARLMAGPLFEAAENSNPLAGAASRDVDVARAERARVYQDRWPDFAVGVRNNQPYDGALGGKASWDVMFEVMIPLQRPSRRAKEREAAQLQAAAEARYEDARVQAAAELDTALSQYEQGRDTLRLFDNSLIPQAQATRDSSRAALASGRVDFDNVIESERQLIDIRERRLRAEVETRLSLIEIRKLTGELK
ncbi:MAG: TolC family protein [Gammaproteobacteria bacterium]|nr:TolC family protein [Gammaproteobacteria bacterium]